MSVEDVRAELHAIADGTECQVTALRGASDNVQALLIELGEVIAGTRDGSAATVAYTNMEITGRCLDDAIDRANRSADLTRAYANTL